MNITISTDPYRLDVKLVHEFLKTAYWCENIPIEVVKRAIAHSLCFGLYEFGHQVGFARVVTDRATFAYLADVFIVESHRGRGLSKRLMQAIVGHPDLQGLRRWSLLTRDAHGLYEEFGFTSLSQPERHMEIFNPDAYKG
jgi:GNAT superfamily N-acetyltransferase